MIIYAISVFRGVYDAMNLISTGIISNLDDIPYIVWSSRGGAKAE